MYFNVIQKFNFVTDKNSLECLLDLRNIYEHIIPAFAYVGY